MKIRTAVLIAIIGILLWMLFFKTAPELAPVSKTNPVSIATLVTKTPYSEICSNLFNSVFSSLDVAFPYDTHKLSDIAKTCNQDILAKSQNVSAASNTLGFLQLVYPVIKKREEFSRMLRTAQDVMPSSLRKNEEEKVHQRERMRQYNINNVHRLWLEYVNGEGIYLHQSPRPGLLRQLNVVYLSEQSGSYGKYDAKQE